MKKIIFIFSLFLSTTLFADNVKLRFSAIDNELESEDLLIEQVQAKLRCHFIRKKDGGHLIRRRYPFTQFSAGKLSVKKSSLTEWLPGFDLQSCAYVLIVTGQDENGKSMLGDIVLMGQLSGQMSESDLAWMQNAADADIYIRKRLKNMVLVAGKDSRGRNRIVEKELPNEKYLDVYHLTRSHDDNFNGIHRGIDVFQEVLRNSYGAANERGLIRIKGELVLEDLILILFKKEVTSVGWDTRSASLILDRGYINDGTGNPRIPEKMQKVIDLYNTQIMGMVRGSSKYRLIVFSLEGGDTLGWVILNTELNEALYAASYR